MSDTGTYQKAVVLEAAVGKYSRQPFSTGQVVYMPHDSHAPRTLASITQIVRDGIVHDDGSKDIYYTFNLSDGSKISVHEMDDAPFWTWPLAGDNITRSAEKALDLVAQYGLPVHFMFNDIKIHVSVVDVMNGLSPSQVAQRYHDESDKAAERYRKSPAGIAAAQKAAERHARDQAKIDELMEELSTVVQVRDFLINWLGEFSEVADNIHMKTDLPTVVRLIESEGYVENAQVGRPQEDFNDKAVMGEYIVGQALNMMKKGMPPHQILIKFAKDYQAL